MFCAGAIIGMWVPSTAPIQAGNPHFVLYVFIMFSNSCSSGENTNVDCKRFTTAAHTLFTNLYRYERDTTNKFANIWFDIQQLVSQQILTHDGSFSPHIFFNKINYKQNLDNPEVFTPLPVGETLIS